MKDNQGLVRRKCSVLTFFKYGMKAKDHRVMVFCEKERSVDC